MRECSLEVLHRLPHGVVEKDTASAYTSMKLCRDVTWLVPHPISISRPRRQQLLNILGGDRERVDKDHGSGVHLQLRKNRDVLIHLFTCYHWSSCSFQRANVRSQAAAIDECSLRVMTALVRI